MKKLLILFLLATFCLQITGCSNNMGTLREKSKTSTTVKFKRINKGWYKHM
ncbi:hypothetical protein P4G85_26065 [Bacillus cereus]|uniref:Lipoprotein n=1 Tax=Bacillus thuringiensis Sbt003 TaxID=1235825 RepID=A0A9X0JXQ1_BACTU|nr:MULTISPECIES: hypothetical protein [Bacillus cereus group]MEB8735277.1 hypothetical protein [Bacillus cereus]KIU73007.1 hypothetical protein C797_20065 [Bacillus thuringiensis Sbt003]MEB8751733.1 hypothetical protein [Bacillus cereus]MEB8764269.1 hypothetical protein [Bacillus cereus]MEB8898143.1 hypothetical protein [Bacillus cereus]